MHLGYCGHECPEQVCLDNVQYLLCLAEDQHVMLRDSSFRSLGCDVLVFDISWYHTNTALC